MPNSRRARKGKLIQLGALPGPPLGKFRDLLGDAELLDWHRTLAKRLPRQADLLATRQSIEPSLDTPEIGTRIGASATVKAVST